MKYVYVPSHRREKVTGFGLGFRTVVSWRLQEHLFTDNAVTLSYQRPFAGSMMVVVI